MSLLPSYSLLLLLTSYYSGDKSLGGRPFDILGRGGGAILFWPGQNFFSIFSPRIFYLPFRARIFLISYTCFSKDHPPPPPPPPHPQNIKWSAPYWTPPSTWQYSALHTITASHYRLSLVLSGVPFALETIAYHYEYITKITVHLPYEIYPKNIINTMFRALLVFCSSTLNVILSLKIPPFIF